MVNCVEIQMIKNNISIQPAINNVELNLFDIYTTRYFLQPTMILEEHKEVGGSG